MTSGGIELNQLRKTPIVSYFQLPLSQAGTGSLLPPSLPPFLPPFLPSFHDFDGH